MTTCDNLKAIITGGSKGIEFPVARLRRSLLIVSLGETTGSALRVGIGRGHNNLLQEGPDPVERKRPK